MAMTRPPVRSTSTTSKPIWIRAPARRMRRRSASNSRRPGTDGGRLAISKTRLPNARSAAACTSACPSRPRTAGMPMRHAPAGSAVGDGRKCAPAPVRVLEQPGEDLRRDVAAPLPGRGARPRAPASSAGPPGHDARSRLRAAYGAHESRIAAEPDEQEAVAGPRLEGGSLRGRQDRRRAVRPDCRGNRDQRIVQGAGVSQALGRGPSEVSRHRSVGIGGEGAIRVVPGRCQRARCRRAWSWRRRAPRRPARRASSGWSPSPWRPGRRGRLARRARPHTTGRPGRPR